MKKPLAKNISIDTFDLILCVALIGGFVTGEWFPLFIFIGLGILAYSGDYKA